MIRDISEFINSAFFEYLVNILEYVNKFFNETYVTLNASRSGFVPSGSLSEKNSGM